MFGKKRSHRQHIRYFETLKGVVGMLRDPEHTESVFDIEDGLRGIDAMRLALDYVRGLPGVADLLEQRYLAPLPDIAALERLPAGSLGRAFADHITSNGFDPDYYRKIDVSDDVDWVLMRMRQTHDVWHVVTGIATDPIGELALKAFELAQTRRPMAAVITSGGVLRYLIKDPDRLGDVLRGISTGFRLGIAARPFLAQRWEDGWAKQLSDWRRALVVELAAHDPTRYRVGRAAGKESEEPSMSGASGDG
jgi:ubiquinone biosynthesis protein Coq4